VSVLRRTTAKNFAQIYLYFDSVIKERYGCFVVSRTFEFLLKNSDYCQFSENVIDKTKSSEKKLNEKSIRDLCITKLLTRQEPIQKTGEKTREYIGKIVLKFLGSFTDWAGCVISCCKVDQ